MSALTHCPYQQSALLQQALAPDKMRIAFLLGAGCPVSVRVAEGAGTRELIPNIRGLTTKIDEALKASNDHKKNYASLLKQFNAKATATPTIEELLSHIRALQDVIRDGNIEGLDKAALIGLDTEICNITTKVVGVDLPALDTPYHQLANWISGVQRANPIEVFTPNYDLLIEQALESHKIPYFDGFVGSKRAFFDLASMENKSLPSRWARLWKLHGSVNWWRRPLGGKTDMYEVVRTSAERSGDDDRQMIYPSHLKYDQSRRMPYLAMLDRLRDFLSRGQTVLVTCGYSFADQHLNEVILHGLESNPNAICFGLLYGARAEYVIAREKARFRPNLSLLAADGAILGGAERSWSGEERAEHPLHGVSVKASKTVNESNEEIRKCEFLLGDFKHLGNFLEVQLGKQIDLTVSQSSDIQAAPNAA